MNSPHILLVDDEPNILKALQRLLFEEDYNVQCADSGEAGLEILRTDEIDLIISDYRMPGLTGIEFFRAARAVQPEAVRIILSGYAEIQALAEAINVGHIYKFIFKPWNDDDLKITIRQALEQKRLARENQCLTQAVVQKNQELERFNQQLESLVEQRTRELLFQNRVLSIWQEVLEQVPISVIGFNDQGDVVLCNQEARQRFSPSLGQPLDEALPEELAEDCRTVLSRRESGPVKFHTIIAGDPFLVHLARLRADPPQADASGGMIILQALHDRPLEPA